MRGDWSGSLFPFTIERIVMDNKLVCLLIVGAVVTNSQLSRADICSTTYLNCDPGLGDLDCLERYYACGRFEEAISALGSEVLEPEQTYLRGASFFGLYAKHRAQSLRCEFLRRARQDLVNYINGWNDSLESPDAYVDSKNMSFLYNAVQLLDAADRIELESNGPSCPESGMTSAQVTKFVENYIAKRIENFFLGTGEPDNLGALSASVLTDLNALLATQVSAAVDAENKIGMGLVEIDSLEKHIELLEEKLYTSGPLSPSVIDDLLSTWGENQSEHRFIEDMEAKAQEVFDNMHPEVYEKLRDKWTFEADAYNGAGIEAINLMGVDGVFDRELLIQIDDVLAGAADYTVINAALQGIQQDWIEYGQPSCDSARPPWWCQ